jgi:Tfp pilus assembly protein PilV
MPGHRLPSISVQTARDESGFTVIEVLVAALVLTVGLLSLLGAFDAGRHLGTSAEMRQTASAMAARELQRIQSQPWKGIALAADPAVPWGTSTDVNDPRHYLSTAICPSTVQTTASCYQWDWNSSSTLEPLVVDAANGDASANPTAWQTTVTGTGGSVRLSGQIYRLVTWTNDNACTAPACGAANDYKRISVVVTVDKSGTVSVPPVSLSTLVTNPAGGYLNPLTKAGIKCNDHGTAVPCTD